MPFGSYQVSAEDGVRNAIRLVKEGGVAAGKLEGGRYSIDWDDLAFPSVSWALRREATARAGRHSPP